MQIFGKKTPLQEFEVEHAKLTRQSERLGRKTEDARSESQRATEAQIKFLTETEHDDAKGEASAQRRVEAATSTLKGLEAAFAKINEQISDAQNRVDQERQDVERKVAADEIKRQVLAFEKSVEPTLMALRVFSKTAGELAHVALELGAISQYAHLAGSELEIAASVAIVDARNSAALVLTGESRIPGRAPPPAPSLPAPVLDRVWTLKPVAWTGPDRIEIRDSSVWVDLPPALAEKAIDFLAAVRVGHPRCGEQAASWRKWHGFGAPELAGCVRLDEAAELAATGEQPLPEQPRIVHHLLDKNFEVVDRGPAYTLKTNSGNPTQGEAA
jgi:hypothetical protein